MSADRRRKRLPQGNLTIRGMGASMRRRKTFTDIVSRADDWRSVGGCAARRHNRKIRAPSFAVRAPYANVERAFAAMRDMGILKADDKAHGSREAPTIGGLADVTRRARPRRARLYR